LLINYGILNKKQSFLLFGGSSLLLGLLGSLVLGFLLHVLVLVHDLLVGGLLGSKSSLSLLDFSDSFLSEGFLILRPCSFDFFNIIKGDSFNSSLFSEDFLFLVLALIGQFEFLVESSPCGGPSKPLGFEFSTIERSVP
jgi:hypothetical protein